MITFKQFKMHLHFRKEIRIVDCSDLVKSNQDLIFQLILK